MSQTSINKQQRVAIPGMKANISIDNVVTKRADADLGIGIGLVEGSTFADVITPADSAAQVFAGFSLQSHDRENPVVGVNNAIYEENAPVSVMTLGSVWIQFIDTPSPGDAVILAVSATNEGKVTDTGGGNTVAATGWKFVQTDTITGLAEITNIGA